VIHNPPPICKINTSKKKGEPQERTHPNHHQETREVVVVLKEPKLDKYPRCWDMSLSPLKLVPCGMFNMHTTLLYQDVRVRVYEKSTQQWQLRIMNTPPGIAITTTFTRSIFSKQLQN
ncbi:unnamed protein product, partial [Choristocarpus tenellus]